MNQNPIIDCQRNTNAPAILLISILLKMRASNAHISGIFLKSVDSIEVSNLGKDDMAIWTWR